MILISRWSMLFSLTVSLLYISIYNIFLRKKIFSYYSTIPYMSLLIIVFARLIFPFEFSWSYVIRSEKVFTRINDFLEYQLYKNLSIYQLLQLIWITGIFVSLFLYFRKIVLGIKWQKIIIEEAHEIPSKYQHVLKKIGVRPRSIFFSDKIIEVINFGIINNKILLPDIDYSDPELEGILLHEIEHVKHKDTLIKLVIHLAGCIFWWNPLLKRIEYDYSVLIEYQCDENVVKNYTEYEKIRYVETLKKLAVIRSDLVHDSCKVGFASVKKKSNLIDRAIHIFQGNYKKKHGLLAIISFELLAFFISYFIVIQPYYDVRKERIDGEICIDNTNSYLKRKDNGYWLYFDGEILDYISLKEKNLEPYRQLEVKQ